MPSPPSGGRGRAGETLLARRLLGLSSSLLGLAGRSVRPQTTPKPGAMPGSPGETRHVASAASDGAPAPPPVSRIPAGHDSPFTQRLGDASSVFLVGALLAAIFQLGYQALKTVVALPRPMSPGIRWPWEGVARRRERLPAVAAPVDRRPVHTGPFAAFRYLPFTLYYVGMIFGVNGYFIYWTAQGWLALQLTNSAAGLSLLFTVSSAPMLLLMLFGGALSDRVERRWLVFTTRLFVFAIIGAMGVASIGGFMTIPVFVLLTLALGVVWAVDLPARQAMVADVVPSAVMANAYAWQSVMMFVGSTVGPITAGLIVAMAGPGPALILGAFGHLLVAAMLLAVKTTQTRTATAESTFRRTWNGVKYLGGHEQILLLVVLACIPTATVWGMQPLLPLVARDVLNGDAATYGWLTGAIGIGSVVGALFVAFASRIRAKGWLAIFGTLIGGLAVVAFAYTRSLPLALSFLLVHGAALGVAQTITAAMAQVLTPPEYQGRVASIYLMTWNLTPVGILTFGAVAQAQGVPFGIWASGLSMVAAVAVLAVARPALRRVRS